MSKKKNTDDTPATENIAAVSGDPLSSAEVLIEGVATNGANPSTAQLFDLDQLRVSQNFADAVGVKRALLTVPVRKPSRQEWFRCHPSEAFRLATYILELKTERETYLVHPRLAGEVSNEVATMMLFTAITRQGVTFLWPVRMPDSGGRRNEWTQSAAEAANVAMKRWVRMSANMALGAYDVFTTEGALDEPEWPDADFQALVTLAFKGRFIDTSDHDVLLRLRGQK